MIDNSLHVFRGFSGWTPVGRYGSLCGVQVRPLHVVVAAGLSLALVTFAGCASGGGGSTSSAEATLAADVPAAEAAVREAMVANGVTIDEQADQMFADLGIDLGGVAGVVRGTTADGSVVIASIAKSDEGEATVTVDAEDPDNPNLEAAILDDVRAELGLPAMPETPQPPATPG